ncbi:MAG TPA: phosphate acyltransferase PlsX [Steroidobacteraceae bacterium]|nr:phosphate acyltransferase PlsX [Steroidobacteraceae bacterium]
MSAVPSESHSLNAPLNTPLTLAIDAMGGDVGPSATVPAVIEVLAEQPDVQCILVGQQAILEQLWLQQGRRFSDRLRIRHAEQVVEMGERAQDALRKKKDSSMRVAIDLVKEGVAHACVSAGNTGALMATARFVLKTIEGIDRPAILTRIPAHHGHTHMLDLGANADCTAQHLLQFAIMGSVIASDLDEVAQPRVGLLNIGAEDIKGNELVQEAAKLLQKSSLNYIGFVEGNDIFSGDVDVVVTDGFTGNVALKTMEGLVSMLSSTLKTEYTRNPLRRFGALASLPVLNAVKRRFDPRQHNGASMVGLNGVVIKSHGSADAFSFANAIRVAIVEARKGVPSQVGRLLESQVQ